MGTKINNTLTLPIKHNASWEVLIRWGIQKGKIIDDLFYDATLPTGWYKLASDNSMWSTLRDNKGRKRADIFYKGTFYDREAFINVRKKEFTVNRINNSIYNHTGIKDALDNIVFTDEPVQYAVMNNQIGVLYKNKFYCTPVKKLFKEEYKFKTVVESDSSVITFTDDEFYQNYHWKNPEFELIKLAEKLAYKYSLEKAEELNSKSDWYTNE